MRDTPTDELYDRYVATTGALAHLRTTTGRRRHKLDKYDFHALGDPFVRDFSVICSSKANRRAYDKNQVATSPHLPHVRNRGTHADEVCAHDVRIINHLGLNEMLGLAQGKGHDLGHFPLGHQGEHYLQMKTGKNLTHEVMGVVVCEQIERGGAGMNLTYEVLEGIHGHSGKNARPEMTQEGWATNISDKIAYIFADYNDFFRMGWKCAPELTDLMNWFGKNQRGRTFRTMVALCEESAACGRISFETSETAKIFKELKKMMYEEYDAVVQQNVAEFLDPIYDFLDRSGRIPAWLGIALLTDEEVFRLAGEHRMISWEKIERTGLGEIINRTPAEHLWNIKCELDLDW